MGSKRIFGFDVQEISSELNANLVGGELPVGLDVRTIVTLLPSGDMLFQRDAVTDPCGQVRHQHASLDLDQVESGTVLRCVVGFQSAQQTLGLVEWEHFANFRSNSMSTACKQALLFRIGAGSWHAHPDGDPKTDAC